MYGQIMRIAEADIMDDGNGGARIVIGLTSRGMGQAIGYPVHPKTAYDLLRLFQVDRLSKAVGKPIKVLRVETEGRIVALGRLDCDPWLEVWADHAD